MKLANNQKNKANSLRQLLFGKDEGLNQALSTGEVQLMRLKNRAIIIDGQEHPDLNLFDLFLDHQNDALFEDYVREHTIRRAAQLRKAKYVVVFMSDGNYSRFAGVYKILGEEKRIQILSEAQQGYEETVFFKVSYLDVFEENRGRILIDWGGREAQCWLQWFKGDKNIIRIDNGIVRIPIPFVSYNDVLLSFKELKNIIETDNVEWCVKLKNVKGVYCIADRKNGMLYVGSAYGTEGIWGRWRDYVGTNGHGNNELLIEVTKEDPNYALKHFQWFILESFPLDVDDSYAIQREELYKTKLCTRVFGYNKN